MSLLVISKPRLMTRVVTTMCAYTLAALPFLVCSGRVGISLMQPFLLVGRQALICIKLSGWQQQTLSVQLESPVLSTLVIDTVDNSDLLSRPPSPSFTNFQLAEMAAFIACLTSISLGYFIGLAKSILLPVTAVVFLGYICDSEKQAFLLPRDKLVKFAALRDSILEHKTVSLKNLQKFAGKTTSFALLVPAAKLFTKLAHI